MAMLQASASSTASTPGKLCSRFCFRRLCISSTKRTLRAERTSAPKFLRASFTSPSLAELRSRVHLLLQKDCIIVQANNSASSEGLPVTEEADYDSDKLETQKRSSSTSRSMLIFKLMIALGIAGALALISICLRRSNLHGAHQNLNFEVPLFGLGSGTSVPTQNYTVFNFSFRGYKIFLPQYPPGWIYFWLLMVASCGLFISEEALNVWVGTSLARLLTFDGSWETFMSTFAVNASYIVSTIFWVYWGVCISDMIPFYVGRFAGRSKAADIVFNKVGIKKEKIEEICTNVQRYGNLIGFVERFSLGIRNKTSFLAGAAGISPECFFLGVCLGGLITLPIQMGIGFLLREQPMAALAGVATVVGIWSVFPYVAAAVASLVYFVHRSSSV